MWYGPDSRLQTPEQEAGRERAGADGRHVLILAAAFTLCVGEARAQTADVCRGGAPTAGERIVCSESDGSTDITINITDFDITTDGIGVIGIFGVHSGTGDIDIDVRGGTIRTQGTASGGIYATQGNYIFNLTDMLFLNLFNEISVCRIKYNFRHIFRVGRSMRHLPFLYVVMFFLFLFLFIVTVNTKSQTFLTSIVMGNPVFEFVHCFA